MKAWRRRLGVGVLVAILVSVTLGAGVIAEGERGRERPAANCEALGRRLREAAKNGDRTIEEARERHNAFCGERGRERPDSGRRDRCEAVALRPPGSQ